MIFKVLACHAHITNVIAALRAALRNSRHPFSLGAVLYDVGHAQDEMDKLMEVLEDMIRAERKEKFDAVLGRIAELEKQLKDKEK